jgi:hypothetical protein
MTEPAAGIDVEPADVVDTTRPGLWWPDLPHFPAMSAIPQDSAVEAEHVARDLLGAVLAYRDAIRPTLDAAAIFTPGPVEDTAELRRRVGMVSDLIARRALSAPCVLTAQHAARLAERVAGLTLRGTPAVLVPRPRELFGWARPRVDAMSAATDAEWSSAVEMCIGRGDLSFDALSAMLSRDDLTAAELEQRGVMARLAGSGRTLADIAEALDLTRERTRELAARYNVIVQSDNSDDRFDAVDTVAVIEDVVSSTASAGREAQRVDLAEIDRLDPSQCADWSRELWTTAKYVLQLRARLDARAAGTR